jgi:hypothetical protein
MNLVTIPYQWPTIHENGPCQELIAYKVIEPSLRLVGYT